MLELPLVPFPLQNLETRRKEADFGARVGALHAAGAFRGPDAPAPAGKGNSQIPTAEAGMSPSEPSALR